MDETVGFRIGRSNRAHLIVNSVRRENADATDYSDGNWLIGTVTIAAGGFRGRFDAQLRTDEFARFRDQLLPLYGKLVGRAVFEPMEPWLRIEVDGDGKGHFRAAWLAPAIAKTRPQRRQHEPAVVGSARSGGLGGPDV